MSDRFLNNKSRKRSDGSISFSPRDRSIAEKRANSKDGRIQRILGKDDTIPKWFARMISNDDNWILERPYLKTELNAFKKTLTALSKSNSQECKELHERLYQEPQNPSERSPICPIWRHHNECRLLLAATSRYVFPRVRNELYLMTIVFEFSHNLVELEAALLRAHQSLKEVVACMTKKRRGVVMFGTFEPDLVAQEQLRLDVSKAKMMQDFNVECTDSGGWILTGHYFVRVPHVELFADILRNTYPSSGWDRVQIKKLHGHDTLEANIMKIIGYAGKYPEPLFKVATRGPKRRDADRRVSALRAAFAGPEFSFKHMDATSFNLNSAICQWALFIDRMGADRIHYSVESVHAQKWYSATEMAYVRALDLDMDSMGNHRIEIQRDIGPFGRSRPLLSHGRYRALRSRPIIFDEEWCAKTSCEGIDTASEY